MDSFIGQSPNYGLYGVNDVITNNVPEFKFTRHHTVGVVIAAFQQRILPQNSYYTTDTTYVLTQLLTSLCNSNLYKMHYY